MGERAPGKVAGCGPVPEELDARVRDRDRSPLPDTALVRFQSIAHSPDPRVNHRWVLHDDGRLHLAFHSRDTAGAVPFDTELPERPTKVLPPGTVEEIRRLLDEEGFASLAPYQWREGEGGMWQVVTARTDRGTHEVIYDRASTPLVDRLQRVASEVPRR